MRSIRSFLVRMGLPALVLIVAVLVYQRISDSQKKFGLRPRFPAVVAWENKYTQRWRNLSFTQFSNKPVVAGAVEGAIVRSNLLAKNLSRAEKRNLIGSLTQWFIALGASSPSQYLADVASLRKLPDTISDPSVLLEYKTLTGSPMPSTLSPQEALDLFWKGRPDTPTRPTQGALADVDGVVFTIGEWDGHGRTKWLNEQEGIGDEWANPASTSFVKITEPLETSQEEVQRVGHIRLLGVDVVVRNDDKRCFVLHISMFWSSASEQWCVEYVSRQTDEIAFWPI